MPRQLNEYRHVYYLVIAENWLRGRYLNAPETLEPLRVWVLAHTQAPALSDLPSLLAGGALRLSLLPGTAIIFAAAAAAAGALARLGAPPSWSLVSFLAGDHALC